MNDNETETFIPQDESEAQLAPGTLPVSLVGEAGEQVPVGEQDAEGEDLPF